MKAVSAVAMILLTCVSASAETAAEFVKADNPTIVKDVGGNKSPSDAMLVGVFDDGSRRDGFAQSICASTMALPDRPRVVRIMDVVAANSGKFKVLGEATCPDSNDQETIEFN